MKDCQLAKKIGLKSESKGRLHVPHSELQNHVKTKNI